MQYVEEHIPGGVEAMNAGFDDPLYTEFFKQPFLAGGLYDIYPLAVAGVTCAAIEGRPFLDFVRRRSSDQAPRDLSGIYKFLLKMVPTGSVAKRIPRLLSQVLAFGSTEVLLDESRHMRGAFHGMPNQLAGWFSVVGEAYGVTALRASGAEDPQLQVEIPRSTESAHGVPVTSLVFDIRW